MKLTLLAGLLLLPVLQDPPPAVEGIPDPWPDRERTAAQRFGMKTIENLPVPELDSGPGDQVSHRLESVFRTRSRWRVFGAKVTNPGHEPLAVTVFLPQLQQEQEITVPALDWNKAFFLVEHDPKRASLTVEVRRNGKLLASTDVKLGDARMGTKWQASIIVDELRRESEFRLKWPRHAARVETPDLPDADLTMLHKGLGLRVTAKTDAKGVWAGRLLGGEWIVYARKESLIAVFYQLCLVYQ